MPATKDALHEVKIDIKEANREKLVALLNQSLADTADLVSQVQQAHWNVRGIDFWQFHKLFDELYEALEPYVDTLAERVTALGGAARGTVRMAAASSSLEEFAEAFGDGKKFVAALRDRYGAYAKALRRNIERSETELEDPTTADLYTEMSRLVEKQLYFLESHLH